LTTEQGGKIILDQWMLDLWNKAGGKSLEELVELHPQPGGEPQLTRAALACLAEASFLQRVGPPHEKPVPQKNSGLAVVGPLVSIIIVSHNSRDWLAVCLSSIRRQAYSPLEVIIVDNASQDGSAEWLSSQKEAEIGLLRLEQAQSLAYALNRGIEAAQGDYYLLLNPDVLLADHAISALVSEAGGKSDCAAVAAKLKYTWAPAFLNGLGNYVGAFSWGTDIGLGHLDLGGFDHWDELPSACFAAALIPARIWEKVGPLDEGFPLYYEDSEWCYRARLFGFSIYAAPQAVVYHAFGAQAPGVRALNGRGTGTTSGMTSRKLRQVVYGRLRFATKILQPRTRRRFMVNYGLEDCARFASALWRGRWEMLGAYFQAWNDYFKSRPELQEQRRHIQTRRVISDEQLLELQRDLPMPLVQNGFPLLSRDIVRHHYLPLMLSGKTRALPELTGIDASTLPEDRAWLRGRRILQEEGLKALCHRFGKYITWRLSQP
jgi:GT2 family glycosyltransferase